ncbi:acyltransferase family protein [Corynebacterium kroppenstedtii]|uniref:acyltransferase family protein n=1 Tax=Corynebacterium sp. PCR 32 TaxID=3351342 RepID=UPI0030A6D1F8
MPRPVGKSTYLPGLDGLRAIAVIAVVLYHLSVPHTDGGLLGVGVFFTLSGYLITSILVRQWDRDGQLAFGDFWLRRFRRLLPAVMTVLATVMLLTAFLDHGKLAQRGWQALSALFYYNNWYEIAAGNSYFDMFAGPQPLSHMWSLAVEEQFYLVWPFVFAGMMVLWRRGTHSPIWAAATCLVLAIISGVWMAYLVEPGVDHTRVYEGTDTRALGLLIGAALAFIWKPGGGTAPSGSTPGQDALRSWRSTPVGRHLIDLIGIAGLVIVLTMMVTTHNNAMWLYQGGFAVLALATAAILLPLADEHSWMTTLLGLPPLRWLGERSYGIYLWHMPVIAFAPEGFIKNHLAFAAPVLAVISISLAALSWTLIENPIRHHGVIALARQWWNGRGETHRREAPPVLTGLATVILLAVLTAGLPKALFDGATSSKNDPDPMAALGGNGTNGAIKVDGNGPGHNAGGGPAGSSATARGGGAHGVNASASIDCSTVIHVGDSTSIALNSPSYLPNPSDRVGAQYKRVGATDVYLDIKGARAVIEHYKDDPNAREAVTAMKNHHYKDACWVIALGTNDAANIAVSNQTPAEDRIRMILDIVKNEKHVLWPTVKTVNPGQSAYANSGMRAYDTALKKMCTQYSNLRLYDWANEVQDNWYIEDGIHPNSVGAKERSRRFADALVHAFPKGKKPASHCTVSSGD